MISFLFKIFIWKMALSLGVLSFLPLSAFPLNNRVVQSSEQRGGDLRQEAETKKSLPLAQRKVDLAPRRQPETEFNLKLSARSFLVLDEASELPLVSQEADTVRPVGSITKLLTVLVFLKNQPDWDKEMIIEAQDGREGRLFLNEGDRARVYDLFYATLVGSSNNAAMALARSTGLSLEDFVFKMNEEASALGFKNTQVVEPTGLNSQNRSTTKEVALLLKAALREPLIKKATTAKSYMLTVIDADGQSVKKEIRATNLLLVSNLTDSPIAGIEGGKTGFIDEAGHSVAVEVKNAAGRKLVVVVLGATSNEGRFNEARALADWTYESYLWPGDTGYGVAAVPETEN